jgi:hypothetical protein
LSWRNDYIHRKTKNSVTGARPSMGGTDHMKNGYTLKLKCVDCGVTFEWPVLPQQLLTPKMTKPSRCASCRRAKRERSLEQPRPPKSRSRKP